MESVDISIYSQQQKSVYHSQFAVDDDEDIGEDIVTPYAIRNVTNMPIYVFTLVNGEH